MTINRTKKSIAALIFGASLSASLIAGTANYKISNGKITKEVLNNYLSHAVTHAGLGITYPDGYSNTFDNDLTMLKKIGAKFIGRSSFMWGVYHNPETGKVDMTDFFSKIKERAAKVHQTDSDIIMQAAIFEIVNADVNEIAIPDWVFKAFNKPIETRNFKYSDMIFGDGSWKDAWGKGQSVPDMTKQETLMWFYYMARNYIDSGINAIHFGQVMLMCRDDNNYDNLYSVLTKIRTYAANNTAKGYVLCDAHSHGFLRDGVSLFDFNSFPLRIKDVQTSSEITDPIYKKYITESTDEPAILDINYSDNIYNKSEGCTTPSGWKCDHLPYIVEFDNWGTSDKEGQFTPDNIFVWGYDEIGWFGHQAAFNKDYANQWLEYAYNWVKTTDPVGHIQFATRRILCSPITKDGTTYHMYNANLPAFGQADTIESILKNK